MSRRYKWNLALIFLTGVVLGLPFLFSKMVGEPDAFSRSNMSTFERKLNREEFFNFNPKRYGSWLSLDIKILGLSRDIYNNIFISPRLVTLIFSAGTIVLIFFYTLLITKSSRSSLLSSMLFLFFPQRIFLATVTLSEPIFVFFLIAALILIFKKPPNYFIGLVLLNIASGIRYEAWFLLPFIWMAIWEKNTIGRYKYFLILVSSLSPIFWLISNLISTGNPIWFFGEKYKFAQLDNPAYWNFTLAFSYWFKNLVEVFTIAGIGLVIYGWYSLIKSKNDDKTHILSILPFWLFILLPIQVFWGTMEYYPHRYLYIPATLALPLLAYGISQCKKRLESSYAVKKFWFYNRIIILILLMLCLQIYINYFKIFRIQNLNFVEDSNILKTVEIIKRKSTKDTALNVLYLQNEDFGSRFWFFPIIAYFAEVPDLSVLEKNKRGKNLADYGVIIFEVGKNGDSGNSIYPLSNYRLEYEGNKLQVFSNL